ncbi:MAG: tetratricopeptide repeat protein [Pseudomonadota bacterium]
MRNESRRPPRPRRRARSPWGAVAFATACALFWAPALNAQPAADSPGGESAEELERESRLPEEREARLDALFDRLAAAEDGPHERVEQEILRVWAQSGSATADLLLQRGRDALGQEDAVRAIAHAGAALDHFPDFAEAWNLRATAFFTLGRYGQALADIEQVLAREPRHFGALSGLGIILEQVGREQDALAAYREAARWNPHMQRVNDAVDRLAPKVDGRDA